MKTIQMSIDELLLQEAVLQLEEQHVQGYRSNPVLPGEFDEWKPEQVWEEHGI